MRIVSLNTWGGAMFDDLIDWLPRSGADVLCLQEVTRTPGLRGWTHFEDTERRLPQRADLFEDVGAALPGHRGRFVASDAGPVRDDNGGTHRQDFGLAVFVDERIAVIGAEESFVHGSYVAHRWWPTGDRPRAAQGVRLADHASDRVVTIVHLHGLRDPSG